VHDWTFCICITITHFSHIAASIAGDSHDISRCSFALLRIEFANFNGRRVDVLTPLP
jgi:hypothetical protein